MPNPNVIINVQDNALGSLAPSTANVGAHMGVCQFGIAGIAASYLYASTTGGDGVTFTAATPGVNGNGITVTMLAPTGGSTIVAVSGQNITITPKTGAINSDIVTAVGLSAPASVLVTAVATGPSDVVNSSGVLHHLTGGVEGTINKVYTFSDQQTVLNTLGQGPLTESLVHSLQVAGGEVIAVPILASVAGTVTPWTHAGSGPGAVTNTGTPWDGYDLRVEILTGGALGTSTFRYSLDGGVTFSPAITTAATYVAPVPGGSGPTGLTLDFSAATYVAGDYWTATATAPSYGQSDVTNGANALLADQDTWGFLHLVGYQSSVTSDASMGELLQSIMNGAQATDYRYAFAILEVGPDTDANIKAAFATAFNRVMVATGLERVASPISGTRYKRSAGFPAAARNALIIPSEDMGYVARGACPGVSALSRDERTSPGLDALGFTTLTTIVGLPGIYFTSGHMFMPATSDYYLSQNRRVMDEACITTREELLPFLNGSLRITSDGKIYGPDASNIENTVQSGLNAAILAPGWCSATSVVVNRSNNILSTKQLLVKTRVTPLGYAKQIVEDIAFFNPALASASAT